MAPATAEHTLKLPEKPAPLLVNAREAARLIGYGEASWWRMDSAGKVPAPVRFSGKTLWRIEELRRWVAAGCPERKAWEAMER